jgi:flagellar motility protein MotE (MotC chaperone)
MMFGLRLIDTVIVAAVALLALKGIGYLAQEDAPLSAQAPVSSPALPETGPHFAALQPQFSSLFRDVDQTGSVPDKKPVAPEPPKPVPQALQEKTSPSERALLERLGERREELQNRNRDIEMREKLLENVEKKLEARINDLKASEERNLDSSGKRIDSEAAGLRNLVTMYETMKPKDAARVFDRLSMDILVPVVMQMNPRKMAEVLAAMSPEAAEKLTISLANKARNAGLEARGQASPPALPSSELPSVSPQKTN